MSFQENYYLLFNINYVVYKAKNMNLIWYLRFFLSVLRNSKVIITFWRSLWLLTLPSKILSHFRILSMRRPWYQDCRNSNIWKKNRLVSELLHTNVILFYHSVFSNSWDILLSKINWLFFLSNYIIIISLDYMFTLGLCG